jgi:hypothetical protein
MVIAITIKSRALFMKGLRLSSSSRGIGESL